MTVCFLFAFSVALYLMCKTEMDPSDLQMKEDASNAEGSHTEMTKISHMHINPYARVPIVENNSGTYSKFRDRNSLQTPSTTKDMSRLSALSSMNMDFSGTYTAVKQ